MCPKNQLLGETGMSEAGVGLDGSSWSRTAGDSPHAWHWLTGRHASVCSPNWVCMRSALAGVAVARTQTRSGAFNKAADGSSASSVPHCACPQVPLCSVPTATSLHPRAWQLLMFTSPSGWGSRKGRNLQSTDRVLSQ